MLAILKFGYVSWGIYVIFPYRSNASKLGLNTSKLEQNTSKAMGTMQTCGGFDVPHEPIGDAELAALCALHPLGVHWGRPLCLHLCQEPSHVLSILQPQLLHNDPSP